MDETFLKYKAMIKTYQADQMDDPSSNYRKLQKEVEQFNDKFEETIIDLTQKTS